MTKKKQEGEDQSANNPLGTSLSDTHSHRMIHPIIMYPFTHPHNINHIEILYQELIQKLDQQKEKYHRPITILNCQTRQENYEDPQFQHLLKNTIEAYSEVIPTWSVDTCQMWLTGFGHAYDKSTQQQRTSDAYWLIPGDFNYDSLSGREVLNTMDEIPNRVYQRDCELCLGEITVPPNSAKQLIDTYGTYGLLYNWFPSQAQGIADITSKPRTEFFAIGHNYLRYALKRRWYPYEQTMVILLHGMQERSPVREIQKIELGEIGDEPQGRKSLSGAIQQIERTERVLKLYWRELYESRESNWPDIFKKLDTQSEKIRGAAMVIFEQLLKRD